MSSLPTSRAFLTSMINTLTSPLPQQTQLPTDETYDTSQNPLKTLPPSYRALLTTLHVLFPPPMLLQALDLLDRGLVTRLVPSEPPSGTSVLEITIPAPISATEVWPPQAHIHLPQPPPPAAPSSSSHPKPIPTDEQEKAQTKRHNMMYSVRSSQPTKGRYASVIGGMIYIVHLETWNCSCAAFAFSAFPASGSGSGSDGVPWDLSRDEGEDEDIEMGFGRGQEEGEGEKEWEFGGLSLDGKSNLRGVPVCKHLLACLLGERWEDVLGGYVKEEKVSREEMAGHGAE